MKNIPWYKKCLGYLFPMMIAQYESDYHPHLKIKYYQGQIQLESADALYSDGHRYTPFRLAFDYLFKKNNLLNVENFLLLGAGLGSALQRLQKIYSVFPTATLVEYDEQIIELSKSYANLNEKNNVEFIQADAYIFLDQNEKQFDLIGIDIFEGLTNSNLLKKAVFWQGIKKACTPNSTIILNTIFTKKEELLEFELLLKSYFTFHRIDQKPNYFYILKLKK